jgi:hypothetical protein
MVFIQKGFHMKTILWWIAVIIFCLLPFLFVRCSNPTKPEPLGICALAVKTPAVGYPMYWDTIVTCSQCNIMANAFNTQKRSWIPLEPERNRFK